MHEADWLKPVQISDSHAQFLLDLTHRGLLWCLSRLEMAARNSPAARILRSVRGPQPK